MGNRLERHAQIRHTNMEACLPFHDDRSLFLNPAYSWDH